MKKSKMISLAAAALLTVAPVIAPTVVHAADTTTSSTSNTTSTSNTGTNVSTNTTTTTDNVNASNPVITYNGQSFDHTQTVPDLLENSSLGYVPLNAGQMINSWVDKIMEAFTATASSSDKTPVRLRFNNESYNGAVAGKYPIVLTATNAQGLTTRLTFDLTVGSKDSGAKYAVARSKVKNSGGVSLFTIRDGRIIHNSYGSTQLANNTTVATFGTETINGISYTRLNGPDSDMFIETDCVNGTYPLTGDAGTNKTVTKTLMHTAIAYDADGHSTGKKYTAYRQLALNSILVNIKGSMYYNIKNTGEYIKASNIDGTKRTLKKNAYVYATSTRRADRTLLRKGTTITTYGGSYKFKNGKRYYRVEGATAPNKRYVKVVNFK